MGGLQYNAGLLICRTDNTVTTPANQHSPAASGHPHKAFWLSLLIIIWLAATLAGLWWFQQQNVRPFIGADDDARFWQASQAEQLLQPILAPLPAPAAGQVTLLQFWNPGCLCNQLSQRHFDALLHQFKTDSLRVVAVAPASASDEDLQSFLRLNGERMDIVRAPAGFTLPASPALALFGPDNRLGYFGAWGFGALCTVANDDFFPAMVRALQNEGYGPFANVAGDGCFCAWPGN